MDDLLELDAAALLAESSAAVQERRLAEVRDLTVLAQWAAVHSGDPTQGPDGGFARRVGNRLRQVGGEGTPGVQDFSLGEIALARGTGVTATRNALADTLDLIHRLPLTWRVCLSGEAEIWVARKVASLSRHLPLTHVGVVDSAVARIIAHESGGRVIAVAEAKIIEAAPGLHEQRAEEQRQRSYVGFGRTDEAGLRTVVARVQAGDAHWVEATLTRVVEIIGPQHPDACADELRAIAFGWLARPAELLRLLLEHVIADDEEPEGDPSRATAMPADLLEALRGADLSALVPRSVLYVHLHETSILSADGVARVEGLGPMTLAGLHELLGRTAITIKPVIDLADRVTTTAYEHPEAVKERVHLITGGDYWPFATSTSRGADLDHVTPYFDPDQGGPSDQTGTHNSGPLSRTHHRWKTHAGYRATQSGHGRYVWMTPHGLAFLVDHRGTRPISPEHAHTILKTPGEIYIPEGPVSVELPVHPGSGEADDRAVVGEVDASS